MTTTTAPQPNLRLNFNNRDYEFDELPRTAQLLLQDMVRLDQELGTLQFQVRHLQAARQAYGARLRQTMNEEVEGNPNDGDAGTDHGGEHGDHGSGY